MIMKKMSEKVIGVKTVGMIVIILARVFKLEL